LAQDLLGCINLKPPSGLAANVGNAVLNNALSINNAVPSGTALFMLTRAAILPPDVLESCMGQDYLISTINMLRNVPC